MFRNISNGILNEEDIIIKYNKGPRCRITYDI